MFIIYIKYNKYNKNNINTNFELLIRLEQVNNFTYQRNKVTSN